MDGAYPIADLPERAAATPPHLFAAVAHRDELRRVSAGALAAFMSHECDDCAYGHPCAESRRLLAAFHAARGEEDRVSWG